MYVQSLHSKTGYITPQEAEENSYHALNAAEQAAQYLNQKLSGKTGADPDSAVQPTLQPQKDVLSAAKYPSCARK